MRLGTTVIGECFTSVLVEAAVGNYCNGAHAHKLRYLTDPLNATVPVGFTPSSLSKSQEGWLSEKVILSFHDRAISRAPCLS